MLPMYTRRIGPSQYEVTVGPPIEIPKGADGNPDYTAAVQAYADALAPLVLRDPGQWRGWRLINARVPWGTKQLARKSEPRNREDSAEDDTEE
jgi:hypothetical protein